MSELPQCDLPSINSAWTFGRGYHSFGNATPILSWHQWPVYWLCRLIGIRYPVNRWQISVTWKPEDPGLCDWTWRCERIHEPE